MAKIKKKTFAENKDYFDFFNKMKEKIEILEIKINDKIKISYYEIEEEK